MDLKNMSLKDFLEKVYEQIKLEDANFDAFQNDDSILLIKSASLDIFINFIEKVREINPDLYFYIIASSRDKESINRICVKNYEMIEYKYEGNYQLSKITKEMDYLKNKKIDKSVLLYNNRYGMGFQNVENILKSLEKYPMYSFNCYNQLFQIQNPELHIESLKMIESISNWFWEYIALIEKR